MPDVRRRFSQTERAALWLAAGGRCEDCGDELQPGWHADHVYPFSEGGPTRPSNGAALCPSCNLKKGSTIMATIDPRTEWQNDAIQRFLSSAHDFLITATPGAGKTRAALGAASALLDAGVIQRVIVVVPSDHLRKQWASAAAPLGIHLTAEHRNGDGRIPADAHGAVITYQQVGFSPSTWTVHATRVPTLVILDEPHHAGEESHWGKALREAFGEAHRRLLLSGTPFRSDGTAIPFVRYDGNGVSIADFPYDYGRATTDGVVRSVRFEVMDGSATWYDVGTREIQLSDAQEERDVRNALRTVIDPKGEWVPSVLRRGDAQLTRDREEVPDAGGLVLAPSIAAAEAYAAMLARICGEPVDVVHSEMPDASERIAEFAQSTRRWLVSVKMVSEGIDIPRLLVGVYCSDIITEMWFRQVVGRFVRRRDVDTDESTATVLIPYLAPLNEMAMRIEAEAQMALREQQEESRGSRESGGTIAINFVEPLGSSESVMAHAILSGDTFDDAELRRAEELAHQAGLTGHPANVARLLRLAGMSAGRPLATIDIPAPAVPLDKHKQGLRRMVSMGVSRLASDRDMPHSHVHSWLNRECGESSIREATVETLQKRIGMLREAGAL